MAAYAGVTSEYGTTDTRVTRVMSAGAFRWSTTISISPTAGSGSPSTAIAHSKPVPARFWPLRMRESNASESSGESP